MASSNRIRVDDRDGTHHYVFRDEHNELVCLVLSEHLVPFGCMLDMVHEAVHVAPAEIYTNKDDWSIEEWYTWSAFDLVPVLEITIAAEAYGIGDEVRVEWTWRKVKP